MANMINGGAAAVLPQEFTLADDNKGELAFLTDLFIKNAVQIFGQKIQSIKELALGKERHCWIFREKEFPVGVVVYKINLSDEYAKQGCKRSLEINSLCVFKPEYTKKGFGSKLLNKAIEEAKKLQAFALHVIVSERQPQFLEWFQKKQFRVVKAIPEDAQYCKHLLRFSLPNIEEALGQQLGNLKIEEQEKKEAAVKPFNPSKLYVADAHWDDIHMMFKLSDGTFVTGSKDGTIGKWDKRGVLLDTVLDQGNSDYTQWITAGTVINNDYWASATRDGQVMIFTTAGKCYRQFQIKNPGSHFSKDRNLDRVHCLSEAPSHRPSYFVGRSTMFTEYHIDSQEEVDNTYTSENDWVYCIRPLSERKLLVVTGTELDVWVKPKNSWKHCENLVKQPYPKPRQRPFISSLTKLEGAENLYGLAVFDGSVRVIDLNTSKQSHHWQEHRERVWVIENITPHIFASCADDRLIKFWDLREKNSIKTIGGHPGRVSAILRLEDTLLVAGTCHTNPRNGGAKLVFYDLKK
jgi:WD40 repeat protein/GNAT superfamily N-acetyltransferase